MTRPCPQPLVGLTRLISGAVMGTTFSGSVAVASKVMRFAISRL